MPMKMHSTTRWTGFSPGRRGSRRNWRYAIWIRARWSSTTSRAVTTRDIPALWHDSAMTGMEKKGNRSFVYGTLADKEGRPLALSVYPGNTGDPATIPDQVQKLTARFGLDRLVLVGDRGMLTQTQIDTVKESPGIGWISALRSSAIRGLVEQGHIQMSLFDTRDLAEIT